MARSFKTLGVALARAASDKKAEAVVLINVAKTSPIADYILIVTASSRPHLEAIEHELAQAAKAEGHAVVHRARPKSDLWRILDFGGLLVHVMTAESRQFYALEKLYADARAIEWGPQTKASPAKRPSSRRRTHG